MLPIPRVCLRTLLPKLLMGMLSCHINCLLYILPTGIMFPILEEWPLTLLRWLMLTTVRLTQNKLFKILRQWLLKPLMITKMSIEVLAFTFVFLLEILNLLFRIWIKVFKYLLLLLEHLQLLHLHLCFLENHMLHIRASMVIMLVRWWIRDWCILKGSPIYFSSSHCSCNFSGCSTSRSSS